MDIKSEIIEPLVEKIENYTKTTLELHQLKFIQKSSGVAVFVFSKTINTLLILLFLTPINIALALFLGDILGKNYFGFLCIAGFYFFVWLIFQVSKKAIKKSLMNHIITQLISSKWKK
jgi:hypothetical protein